MKSAAVLSLLLASTYAIKVPENNWDALELDFHKCLAGSGGCHDKTNRYAVASGIFNKEQCNSSKDLEWNGAFENAAALRKAVEEKEARLGDSDESIYIVRVNPKMLVTHENAAKWSKVIGREVGEYIKCEDSPIMMIYANKQHAALAETLTDTNIDGELSNVFDVVIPMPEEFKVSPHFREENDSDEMDIYVHLSHGCSNNKEEAVQIAQSMQRKLDTRRELTPGHKMEAHTKRALLWSGIRRDELHHAKRLLAEHPEAQFLLPREEFYISNYDATRISSTGTTRAVGGQYDKTDGALSFHAAGIDGTGQVVGIGDSGLDTDHCMFDDPANPAQTPSGQRAAGNIYPFPANHRKMKSYLAYADGVAGEARDHGTHVAGSVTGYGTDALSQGHAGAAPGAKIHFFDIGLANAGGGLRVPQGLEANYFNYAKDDGAFIHTNSWGSARNDYQPSSLGSDIFMWENQDFIVLVAAGNAGPRIGNGGGTVGSPATSKSCVSVGASQNTDANWAQVTGNAASPCQTKVQGKGCEESQAEFSSEGPTADNRMKPDVSAPGFYIISANSNPVPGTKTCGLFPNAGTSMATPITAGIITLARQYFTDGYYPAGIKNAQNSFIPMGSLLRAVLINSARPMSGQYNGVNLNTFGPNTPQGYGAVNIGNTLRLKDGPVKTFVNGDFGAQPKLATGAKDEYEFKIKAGSTANFVATIAWSDYPSSLQANQNIVNDLDLTIVVGQTTHYPDARPGTKGTQPNNLDSAEQITLTPQNAPEAFVGDVVVKVVVTGTNVPQGGAQGGQPYSIVVRGEFSDGKANAGNLPPGSGVYDPVGGSDGTGTPSGALGGGATANGNGSGGGMDTTTLALIGAGVVGVAGIAFFVSKRKRTNGVPPAAMMAPAAAPGGGGDWAQATDPSSGKPYYFNRATGEVSWTPR